MCTSSIIGSATNVRELRFTLGIGCFFWLCFVVVVFFLPFRQKQTSQKELISSSFGLGPSVYRVV